MGNQLFNMKFLVLFAVVACASATTLVTYPNGAVAPAKTPEVVAAEAAHFAAKGVYAPYAYANGYYGGYPYAHGAWAGHYGYAGYPYAYPGAQSFYGLLDIHKVAGDKGDGHLCDFLESEYLSEQVEGIKAVGDLITKMKRAGDGLGLHIIDKEMGS